MYTRITALSGARPGGRVLHIGCGGGYLARLLSAAPAPDGQVTGLDTSAPAIGYSRKRAAANCSFVVGVAQDLPWPDRSFDVVASTLAAHHIPARLVRMPSARCTGCCARAGPCWSPISARLAGDIPCAPGSRPAGTAAPSRWRTWRPPPDSASRPAVTSRCCAMSGPSAPAVLVLARLCRHYRLDLAGPGLPRLRGFVTLRPAGPVRMRLTRRG